MHDVVAIAMGGCHVFMLAGTGFKDDIEKFKAAVLKAELVTRRLSLPSFFGEWTPSGNGEAQSSAAQSDVLYAGNVLWCAARAMVFSYSET